MMSDNKSKINLPSIDDLFSTQAQRDESKLEKIVKIPIKYIGLGEKMEQLQVFNREVFVEMLFNK